MSISVGLQINGVGSMELDNVTLFDQDTQPPVVSLTAPTSGQTVAERLTLSANASDDQGLYSVDFLANDTLIGTARTAPYTISFNTRTLPNGSARLVASALDLAGNRTASSPVMLTVNNPSDPDPPSTSVSCNGQPCATYVTSPVLIALSAVDVGVSGVARIAYTIDGSDPTSTNGAEYSGPFSLTVPVTLRYRAWDNAGNAEAVQTQALALDTTPPTATATLEGPTDHCAGAPCKPWYRGPVTVTLASADSESGVGQIRYTLDASDPPDPLGSSGQLYLSPFTVPQSTIVRFSAIDAVGNVASPPTLPVNIDTVPPTNLLVRGLANGDSVTGKVRLSASVTDDVGIYSVRYYVDGAKIDARTIPPYDITWDTTTLASGSHTVVVAAADYAGNKARAAMTVNVH
jgi:hypothetical protein